MDFAFHKTVTDVTWVDSAWRSRGNSSTWASSTEWGTGASAANCGRDYGPISKGIYGVAGVSTLAHCHLSRRSLLQKVEP